MFEHELIKYIEGCKRNDPKSQKWVFDRYYRLMFGVCLRYYSDHDRVKDIVQEGFLKVFSNIEGYTSKGSFEGWLKRVTINTVLQQYRNQKVFDIVNENIIDDTEIDIDEDAISIDYLLQIIQELPDRYRLIFNLYVLDGYSHKDIASMLDINIGTSKSNLARARQILKKTIVNYRQNINLQSL